MGALGLHARLVYRQVRIEATLEQDESIRLLNGLHAALSSSAYI